MPKALIVYASFTGNTEQVANLLVDDLKQLGVEVRIEECTQISAKEFKDCDICVIATYTWGSDAELPDEFYDMYDELPMVDLTGKIYGVLGTGDDLYDKFCQSVDDFDEQFKRTNATRGADSVKVDSYPQKSDEVHIATFARSLVETYKREMKAVHPSIRPF